MAADKFEVASCMRYFLHCFVSRASFHVLMAEAVQPLTDAAKQYLAARYKDVASEDVVYDFVLKWAKMHYPKIEDRREVLGSRLGRLIRFPYMTCRKLKKVLTCEAPHRQRTLAAEESAVTNLCKPVPIWPSLLISIPSRWTRFLSLTHCNMDQQSSFHCFGLFLGMQEKGSIGFAVDYEFAARSKPSRVCRQSTKEIIHSQSGKAVGYRNLFAIPWTNFMADDSLYFINGILHLRAELTIKH
ncbi:hypothetical protein MKX03_036053 [Papaver bracteatum]|nr:hypothetical protein MKX03_036053 [Papaver bracteatum]